MIDGRCSFPRTRDAKDSHAVAKRRRDSGEAVGREQPGHVADVDLGIDVLIPPRLGRAPLEQRQQSVV